MGPMDLLDAIIARDREALAGLVADDVVFHSPATTYRGREQVVDVLDILGSVFQDITRTREVETVTFVTGRAGDEELDGALVEIQDSDGRVAKITLLLRPLAGVQAGVRLMARALAEGA
jgi:ketosteroid isomerase-like protein